MPDTKKTWTSPELESLDEDTQFIRMLPGSMSEGGDGSFSDS